jgi:hypothetical protein
MCKVMHIVATAAYNNVANSFRNTRSHMETLRSGVSSLWLFPFPLAPSFKCFLTGFSSSNRPKRLASKQLLQAR